MSKLKISQYFPSIPCYQNMINYCCSNCSFSTDESQNNLQNLKTIYVHRDETMGKTTFYATVFYIFDLFKTIFNHGLENRNDFPGLRKQISSRQRSFAEQLLCGLKP